jgi:transposase
MSIVPRPYPQEFREDVVRVARQGDAPIKQVAADFGIAVSCLRGWMRKADIEDGVGSGVTETGSADLRDARKRIKLLEQENEVLRRAAAYLSQANLRLGQSPK